MDEDTLRIVHHLLLGGKEDTHPPGSNAAMFNEFRRKHLAQHLPWLNSLRGIGIGEKIKGGEIQTREPHFRAYVVTKRDVSDKKTVPEYFDMPGLGIVKTDVIQIGPLGLQDWPRPLVKPACPGCSVGGGLMSGTLGCIVKDTGTGGQYILSNSHVLANSGNASLGTNVTQPSMTSEPENLIGHLSKFVEFNFSKRDNLCDAAIAIANPQRMVTNKIPQLSIAPSYNPDLKITRSMKVKKVGNRTGLTFGNTVDVDFRTFLRYQRGLMGSGKVWFKDQVLCDKFTKKGDSGSAVLSENNEVIGLHFAGGNAHSIFNKFHNVMDQLGIEVL